MQYDINTEVAKILALSSGKIDKQEYLKGEEILASDQSRIDHVRFIYCPLAKAFEKQIKKFQEQGKKHVKDLEVLKSNIQKLTIKDVILENTLTEEAKSEFNKIKEIEINGRQRNITNEYTQF